MVPLGAARTLPGLWHCFGCAPAKSVLEGTEPQENMYNECPLLVVFVYIPLFVSVVGGDLGSLSKTPDRGLEGVALSRVQR